MKCRCKVAIACLLILAVLVPLSLGCGGGGGDKVTIHVGQLTDFTGVSSPALRQITFITEDMIKYYNDENVIPGVKLKLDAYDTQLNPARYSLGYEWCKAKGARVIITITPDAPLMLKPFAERDKVILAAMAGAPEMFTPPGWVFGFSSTNGDSAKTLLHWIRQNHWKGQGTPKIAIIGCNTTASINTANVAEAYLKAHPEEYDYVDRITNPMLTITFTAEARKLKDSGCDYIAVANAGVFGPLLRDLRAVGSKATLLECEGTMGALLQMNVQIAGWDKLDGQYSTANSYSWNNSDPIVDLAKTLVHRYHSSSEAAEIIASGNGYVGPAAMLVAIFEIMKQAVEKVGAENFDGQAYYDAAIDYKTTSPIWQNYPEFGFSQTRRMLMDQCLITGFKSGDVKDYVTLTGWLPTPLIEE